MMSATRILLRVKGAVRMDQDVVPAHALELLPLNRCLAPVATNHYAAFSGGALPGVANSTLLHAEPSLLIDDLVRIRQQPETIAAVHAAGERLTLPGA